MPKSLEEPLASRRETYRRSFLALLVIAVTIAFVAVTRSFLMTVLLAAIFSALVHPFYRRLLRLFRGRQTLASGTTLVLIAALVVVPLVAFIGVLVTQAVHVSQSAMPWIQQQIANPGALMTRIESLPGFERIEPYREQVLTKLGELVGSIGSFVVSKLSDVTKGTLALLLQIVILLYAMFFFLMRGRPVLERILVHLPLSKDESALIVERFVSVTRAALASTVVIGVVQGTLGGLALWVAGIKGAVFWGTLMAVTSMIPGVGATLVWLPACIYLILSDRVAAGMLLFAFCGVIVGSVDNVIRPRIVGKGTNLPELVVLISTLGGIMLMGAVGFIIGPVIAALFITIWEIYTAYIAGSTVSSADD